MGCRTSRSQRCAVGSTSAMGPRPRGRSSSQTQSGGRAARGRRRRSRRRRRCRASPRGAPQKRRPRSPTAGIVDEYPAGSSEAVWTLTSRTATAAPCRARFRSPCDSAARFDRRGHPSRRRQCDQLDPPLDPPAPPDDPPPPLAPPPPAPPIDPPTLIVVLVAAPPFTAPLRARAARGARIAGPRHRRR